MAGIFENPTAYRKHTYSDRQKKYFASKKDAKQPDRHVVKHEQNMQIDLAQWIRDTLPGIHFLSDTGSGDFNSKWQKQTHNKQQSAKGLPDMTIFAARKGYHGLLLELKTEQAKLTRKRDATKQWVRKDKNGKIIERDHKLLRKAGDWYDPHVERQHIRHEELKAEGYYACFAVGIEQAKKIICRYFDIDYVEQSSLF